MVWVRYVPSLTMLWVLSGWREVASATPGAHLDPMTCGPGPGSRPGHRHVRSLSGLRTARQNLVLRSDFRVKLQTFTLIQYKTTQSQFSELGAASDVISGILSFIMQLGCKESCTLADGCRNFEKVLGACLSFIFPASNLFSQIYA